MTPIYTQSYQERFIQAILREFEEEMRENGENPKDWERYYRYLQRAIASAKAQTEH